MASGAIVPIGEGRRKVSGYVFRLIVIFVLFFLVSMNAEAETDDTRPQIDALKKALSEKMIDDAGAKSSVIELVDKIIASKTAKGLSKKDKDDLVAIITKTNNKLFDLMAAVNPNDPQDSVDALEKALTDKTVDDGGVKRSISEQIAKIIDSQPAYTLPKKKKDELIGKIKNTTVVFDKLVAAVKPYDPRINIIGAWHGYFNRIQIARETNDLWADHNLFCFATRAVRNRCQGKPACFNHKTATEASADKSGSTDEISWATLCGGSPGKNMAAITADEEKGNVGLVVAYVCVTLKDETWQKIGIDEPNKKIPDRAKFVALRKNMISEIRCQGATPE